MYIGSYYFEFPTSFPELNTTGAYFVLFVFLTFCLSRIFRDVLKPYVILIADLIFLYSFSLYHLFAILIFATTSYLFGLLIGKKQSKFLLALSVLPLVFVLVYFKYAHFVVPVSLMMPLGLSFYTFKIISYLADVYHGKYPAEKNPLYYFDYVLFFPCITAGPINEYRSFRENLTQRKPFDYKQAKGGGFLMMLGIFEKMVFCDFVASVVNRTLDNPEVVFLGALLGIVLYSFQIYLDFDACSNIAIGAARLLGFELPKNFNSPYLARTLNEFWNRWHISLSTWLRNYIYIPLGGNRKGKFRRYLNLFIVFLISGLWHGSTVNFLVWGLAHALIQIIELLIMEPFKKVKLKKLAVVVFSIWGVIINFTIVTLLWLIFRYETMGEVFAVLQRVTVVSAVDPVSWGLTFNECIWLIVVLAITVLFDIFRDRFDMIQFFNRLIFPARWLVYAVLVLVFLVFGMYGGSFDAADFIYKWF